MVNFRPKEPAPGAAMFKIELIGPLKISGPSGENLTPRGAKTQGLVALVVLAGEKGCSRAWIQDKLWSDRGQVQGRNSLKKAIAELRCALGEFAPLLLSTEGGQVRLRMENLDIDIYSEADGQKSGQLIEPEFLEGIDIRDSEFDIWLQSVRTSIENQRQVSASVGERQLSRPVDMTALKSCFHIGILPVRCVESDGAAGLIGDIVLDRLAVNLRSLGAFTVFDYRKARATEVEDSPSLLDVTLHLAALSLSGEVTLQLSAQRISDNVVIWGDRRTLDLMSCGEEAISAIVGQISDQLAHALFGGSWSDNADAQTAAGLVLHAIDQMFRISSSNLKIAENSFQRAVEIDPRGPYFAWYAFLSAFLLEDHKGDSASELLERTRVLECRALEADRHNPLSLALLTHVNAFVSHDFPRAFELVDRALSMQRDLAMLHDSHAMLRFYTGDLETARAAAERALALGKFSPYRYSFATSLCMINTVAGDHRQAIEFGQRALAMHASGEETFFEPTLRYLCASYANIGDWDGLAPVIRRLRAQDPEISADRFNQCRHLVPNPDSARVLTSGFEKIAEFGI